MFLGGLLCTQDYVYLTDGDSKNAAQILKKGKNSGLPKMKLVL